MRTNQEEFAILKQEVLALHWRWQIVEELYSTDATVDVLNKSAPDFFEGVFRALIDSVILGITRLVSDTDSRTLTLRNLAAHHKNTSLGVSLDRHLAILDQQLTGFKLHRDKRIAHHDGDAARHPDEAAAPFGLPSIQRKEIDSALLSIRKFMNEITHSVDRSTIAYERILSHGGADQLVLTLRDGLRLAQLRRSAWEGISADALISEVCKHPDQYETE